MPKITGPAKRLRIYLCEQDRRGGKTIYQDIVHKAKELGLAGATVFRGVMGYGSSSRIHTVRIVDLACDLPIIVEIIDSEEYINKLSPYLDAIMEEGLVTIEDVDIIKYGNTQSKR